MIDEIEAEITRRIRASESVRQQRGSVRTKLKYGAINRELADLLGWIRKKRKGNK